MIGALIIPSRLYEYDIRASCCELLNSADEWEFVYAAQDRITDSIGDEMEERVFADRR